MLLRSLRCSAASRPRHTWMALMVDECGAMAPTAITAFVESGFPPHTGTGAAPTDAAPSPSTQSSSPPPGRAPEERAHAWVAVARLLCEGGDWARAAAVVEGLPSVLQQQARFKAVRDDWPLPTAVVSAWRTGKRHATAAPIEKKRSPVPLSSVPPPATPQPQHAAAATVVDSPASVDAAPPTRQERYELHSTAKLLQIAYSLRRAPPPSSPSTTPSLTAATAAATRSLQRTQSGVIRELRRRGAVGEALQCIVNWQRRQLLRPDADVLQEGGDAVEVAAHLFDGAGATKMILFPGAAPTTLAGGTGGGAAESSGAFVASGGGGGEPARYAPVQLAHITAAVNTHPTLVARCLRDRVVAERFLRYAGEAAVADVVALLLQAIALAPKEGKQQLHAVSVPAISRTATPAVAGIAADAETCWRALAAVLPLLHPYWRIRNKTEKERLVRALAGALDATRKAVVLSAVGGEERGAAAAARPSHMTMSPPSPASSLCMPPPHRSGALSERCSRAIKSAVESVCSPLLHHEPQVRFIRLGLFGHLAEALTALHIGVPNALLQCLFLCLADPAAAAAAAAVAAPQTGVGENVSAFLSASPSQRWLPALALLRDAHTRRDCRVTAAHERALLGGMQSVSITKTWKSALRVVQECETAFGVKPDARTLPTLLLNLKQQSWQDAFRVLRYVPGGEPSAASPQLLRDLQLVALKHASWELPLQLMASLQERGADGFMNYLYCLCAAGRGGQADAAFAYFSSLHRGRGRHTAWQDVSPYNELTVAVAAVAMLDGGHYDALHAFAQRVVAMTKAALSESSRCASTKESTPPLTRDGWLMAHAADMAALLFSSGKAAELTALFTALPADALPPTLHRLVALSLLLGMDHLHAPIRLVFDVLGHSSFEEAAAAREAHRGFLDSVAALQVSEGTYETRQRSTVEHRRPLFVPPTHQQRQRRLVASQLGAFVKTQEAVLPAEVVRVVAGTMVSEGVGAEYMAAALL